MVASYPPTGQVTWVAGQRLDAADLNPWPPVRVPWGVITEAAITSPSAAFTAQTDITGLSITFTAAADRLYRVFFDGQVNSDTAAVRVQVLIADGSNNVQVSRITRINASSVYKPLAFATRALEPGAGSVTYKIRAAEAVGSGTTTIRGTADEPSFIWVEDIGPAS